MFSLLSPLTGIVCNAFTPTICLKQYSIGVNPHVLSWNIIWTKHQVHQSLITKALKMYLQRILLPNKGPSQPSFRNGLTASAFSISQRRYSIKPAECVCHCWLNCQISDLNYPAQSPCYAPPWKHSKHIFQRDLSEPRSFLCGVHFTIRNKICGAIITLHNSSWLQL